MAQLVHSGNNTKMKVQSPFTVPLLSSYYTVSVMYVRHWGYATSAFKLLMAQPKGRKANSRRKM